MEIIPDIDEKVIYPKGVEFEKATILNHKVRQFHQSLIHKLPNEFRYMLKSYNHRSCTDNYLHIDSNKYNHF